MTNQLQLLESHRSWRLDRTTRERGRAGVAAARAAMRASRAASRSAAVDEGEAVEFDHREAA